MLFKSTYSWTYLILAITCSSLGVSGLLDSDPDVFGLRDTLAWILALGGVFAGYQFINITFRNGLHSK